MKHKFYFGTTDMVLAKDASTKDAHWYDVNDPRNALNKRRREDTNRSSKRHHKWEEDKVVGIFECECESDFHLCICVWDAANEMGW